MCKMKDDQMSQGGELPAELVCRAAPAGALVAPVAQPAQTPKPDEGQTMLSLEAAQGDGDDLDAMCSLIQAIIKSETNGQALGIIATYRRSVREKCLAARPAPAPIAGDVEKDARDAAKWRYVRKALSQCKLPYNFMEGYSEDEIEAELAAAMLANSSSGEAG